METNIFYFGILAALVIGGMMAIMSFFEWLIKMISRFAIWIGLVIFTSIAGYMNIPSSNQGMSVLPSMKNSTETEISPEVLPIDSLDKTLTSHNFSDVPYLVDHAPNIKKDTTPTITIIINNYPPQHPVSTSKNTTPKLSDEPLNQPLEEELTDESITYVSNHDLCNASTVPANRYVIFESAFSEETNALREATELKSLGFRVTIIWLPCYQNEISEAYYAVILERPTRSHTSILEKQKLVRMKARRLNYKLKNSRIMYLGEKE